MKTIVAERLCGFQGRPEGELRRLDRTAKQSQEVRQVDQTRQRPDPSLFVTRHGISREVSVPLKYFQVKCMGSWLSGVRDDFQDFPPIFHALQCHARFERKRNEGVMSDRAIFSDFVQMCLYLISFCPYGVTSSGRAGTILAMSNIIH